MSQPHTWENSLRIHDQAFYDWFGGLTVDYSNLGTSTDSQPPRFPALADKKDFPILRIYASPTRPFAALTDMLVARGFVDGTTASQMRETASKSRDMNVFPLPVLTLQRGEPRPDNELSGVPKRHPKIYLNPVTGLWEIHRWPAHYLTDYTATFWCHKRYTEAYIREWIMSQLGAVGAYENEVFLQIPHDPPFGLQPHSMRMESSADLSDLEGEEQRFIRFEYSFTLRTWVMREAVVEENPVHFIGEDVCLGAESDGRTSEGGTLAESVPAGIALISENLYRNPFSESRTPGLWPRTGVARVKVGSLAPDRRPVNALQVTVETEEDSALLAERLLKIDTVSNGILSVSFNYMANRDATVEITERDYADSPESLYSADVYSLPATGRKWGCVHRFTVVSEPAFLVNLVGTGDPGDENVINLDRIDIRYVQQPQTKIVQDEIVPVAGGDEYRWAALAPVPYLLILVLSSTTGAAVIEARDDVASPQHIQQRTVEQNVNVGGVFLIQPLASTLALKVPTGATLASAYLVRYAGAYNGSDV